MSVSNLIRIAVLGFLAYASLLNDAQASSIRFRADQIEFTLTESDGIQVQCSHLLLSHVPWWNVTCGEREYTVDIWMQILTNSDQSISKLSLMFHASEGVRSSGEKLVQFRDHWTHFTFDGLQIPKAIETEQDVRNGLATLTARVTKL